MPARPGKINFVRIDYLKRMPSKIPAVAQPAYNSIKRLNRLPKNSPEAKAESATLVRRLKTLYKNNKKWFLAAAATIGLAGAYAAGHHKLGSSAYTHAKNTLTISNGTRETISGWVQRAKKAPGTVRNWGSKGYNATSRQLTALHTAVLSAARGARKGYRAGLNKHSYTTALVPY